MTAVSSIDGDGAERCPGKTDDVIVLLIFGVGEGVEELSIARRTADIFGRAAAAGGDEDWTANTGEAWLDLLDLDRVLPASPKA